MMVVDVGCGLTSRVWVRGRSCMEHRWMMVRVRSGGGFSFMGFPVFMEGR